MPVTNEKFSNFVDGGDIEVNDIVVGLRNGLNTRFVYNGGSGIFLPLAGGAMSGVIDMQNNAILNLPDPTNVQQAANKEYVDNSIASAVAAYLPLAGGTMSGAINMGTHAITNMANPTNPQDAATKAYVDSTGSGTVSPGLINQIAWYAASGTTVSGLSTAASSVLVTSAGSVPSLSTTLPSGLTIPGYAHSGANSDITSMTGLTGYLKAPLGLKGSDDTILASFYYQASAVNYLVFQNSATGNPLTIYGGGSDSTCELQFASKGGVFSFYDINNVAAGKIRFLASNPSKFTGLSVNPAQSTAVDFILPATDGSNGQVMYTDGSGNLGFKTVSGGVITIDGDSGSVTGSTITVSGGSTGLTTSGSGTTLDLTGILALANGGTNNNLTASAGGIVWCDSTKFNILSGTPTANQILLSGNASTPSWSTATYPATAGTQYNVLQSTGTNITSAPLSSVIDGALGNTQGDILYRGSSGWTVLAPGTSGYILKSGGAAANPSWEAVSASGAITTIDGDSGSVTPTSGAVLIDGGSTGLTTSGSGNTLALTGILGLAHGGTNKSNSVVQGAIAYCDSAGIRLTAAGTTGQLLQSNGTGQPSWTTATYQATCAAGDLIFASATNVYSNRGIGSNGSILTVGSGLPQWLSSSASSVLIADSGALPVFSTTLPDGLAMGTPASLTLTNATGLPVGGGGTGNSTFTAYSVICAGTTATGAFQNVSGLGTSGQVLTSNGAGALPTWQAGGSGPWTATGTNSAKGGDGTSVASGSNSLSYGSGTNSNAGDNSICVGHGNTITSGSLGVAMFGYSNTTNGSAVNYCIISGNSSSVGSNYGFAFGAGCSTTSSFSVALGTGCSSGHIAFAFGNTATASGTGTVALGQNVTASNAGSFVFADQSNTGSNTADSGQNQFVTRFAGGYFFAGGNLALTTAGQGLSVKSGSNCKIGTATLSSGTVTVSNTSVTANSLILCTVQSASGTQGVLSIGTVTAGTSFVINSTSGSDNSVVGYLIVEKG